MTAADLARVCGLPRPLVRQRSHLCETGQVAGQPYCDQEFGRQVQPEIPRRLQGAFDRFYRRGTACQPK
jgi:hypothetical protein